jgi:hypothetical protein
VCSVPSNFTKQDPCAPGNVSLCPNGRVDIGEECDSGIGCNATCQCKPFFVPKVPAARSCELNLTEVCGNHTGFFCPAELGDLDSSYYVMCAGANTTLLRCPNQTFCRANGTIIETNPCVFTQPICGNGKVEVLEECEVGGAGCLSTCKCREGWTPASPASFDCINIITQPPPTNITNFTQLCALFGRQGYFCASKLSDSNDTKAFVYCGINGTFAGTFRCPAGTTCAAENFTIYNPCLWEQQCGNGLLEAGEECDSGLGCNASCQCEVGFVETRPIRTVNCQLENATQICLAKGAGLNTTTAVCVPSLSYSFLICDANGAKNAQFALCPLGTRCDAQTPVKHSPCS